MIKAHVGAHKEGQMWFPYFRTTGDHCVHIVQSSKVPAWSHYSACTAIIQKCTNLTGFSDKALMFHSSKMHKYKYIAVVDSNRVLHYCMYFFFQVSEKISLSFFKDLNFHSKTFYCQISYFLLHYSHQDTVK